MIAAVLSCFVFEENVKDAPELSLEALKGIKSLAISGITVYNINEIWFDLIAVPFDFKVKMLTSF